jgi:hypothetical protein
MTELETLLNVGCDCWSVDEDAEDLDGTPEEALDRALEAHNDSDPVADVVRDLYPHGLKLYGWTRDKVLPEHYGRFAQSALEAVEGVWNEEYGWSDPANWQNFSILHEPFRAVLEEKLKHCAVWSCSHTHTVTLTLEQAIELAGER